jgi:hypothetical protein
MRQAANHCYATWIATSHLDYGCGLRQATEIANCNRNCQKPSGLLKALLEIVKVGSPTMATYSPLWLFATRSEDCGTFSLYSASDPAHQKTL